MPRTLSSFRICDFCGQLAGAGATKWLSSFGAEVIRIEDPVNEGRWDILRGNAPFVDDRRGIDFGGGFNNHNTDKLGITLNLRTKKGKELLAQIIEKSDVVTENFAKGVLAKWGFSYEQMKEIKPEIIYVSNCGFGHSGPYSEFRTWGPVVQAFSGLTFTSTLAVDEPAGWGYSYMDHTGGHYMVMAILMALIHKQKTGEGQWIDLATTDTATTLHGPTLLDWTVNNRAVRRDEPLNSNRNQWPAMAPHGIYSCEGDDNWIAIACRNESDWLSFTRVVDEDWCSDSRFSTLAGRLSNQDELDQQVNNWSSNREKFSLADSLNSSGIPASAVQKPEERIDKDPTTRDFGLWPTVEHSKIGKVRVDGQPVHFSKSDWQMTRGAPCLGEHTEEVLTGLLGLSKEDVTVLRSEGVI